MLTVTGIRRFALVIYHGDEVVEARGSGRSDTESGEVEAADRKLHRRLHLCLDIVEALEADDEDLGEGAKVNFLGGQLIFMAPGAMPEKRVFR